ncbi:YdcF family protein [Nocardia sp. NBC_01503]|uniref:YdcF family protein n=1 Tax=Nocardia sp. NBC_01503 TaxID=2975997 RepID=UPI002E7C302F|nr:YdcF family protein [Nocardia sp. NBC_01503]WTL32603.1 YdcF family protein [Nocardia sp. NBC_01503]
MYDLLPAVPVLRHLSRNTARLAVRTLLAGATVAAITAAAIPAHAEGSAVPATPIAGITEDVVTALNSVTNLMPGLDLPGLDLPAMFSPTTAIVVLGYGLQPDGDMRPELINRLYAGYVSALLSPEAPVIVTGGNPQNGRTEAQAMADWMIARGIHPERIHSETKANSTVQNAAFSAQLMEAIGAHAAILITSADHIARALSNFRSAGIAVVATMTPDESPLSAQPFGPVK